MASPPGSSPGEASPRPRRSSRAVTAWAALRTSWRLSGEQSSSPCMMVLPPRTFSVVSGRQSGCSRTSRTAAEQPHEGRPGPTSSARTREKSRNSLSSRLSRSHLADDEPRQHPLVVASVLGARELLDGAPDRRKAVPDLVGERTRSAPRPPRDARRAGAAPGAASSRRGR